MASSDLQKAFTPIRLRKLTIRNRFVKTATNEGMWTDCLPNQQLADHHARLAKGGIGLTTVAYGAVNPDGRTNEWQMHMRPEVVPRLRKLTDEVHRHGGAASIQLTHFGFFTNNRLVTGKRPIAPSRIINNYGLLSGIFFSRQMTTNDLRLTTFPALPAWPSKPSLMPWRSIWAMVTCSSQFLSPRFNRRKDEYGGSLENRLRFPLSEG